MKLLIITFLLALGSNTLIAQNEVPPTPPPPMDIPDEENEPLIDKLIKVAEYELMFDMMKDEIVQEFAVENNWSKHKIKDVKSQIKYKDVPDWIFYNGYASETKEELNRLIAYYKKKTKEELIKEFPKYKFIIRKNFENNIRQGCKEAL